MMMMMVIQPLSGLRGPRPLEGPQGPKRFWWDFGDALWESADRPGLPGMWEILPTHSLKNCQDKGVFFPGNLPFSGKPSCITESYWGT